MTQKFDFSALTSGYQAPWPVTVRSPNNGVFVETTFTAMFRMIEPEEFAAIQEREAKGDKHAYIKSFFVGLGEGETSPLPFEETQAAMLKRPDIRVGLVEAYNTFVSGDAAKN